LLRRYGIVDDLALGILREFMSWDSNILNLAGLRRRLELVDLIRRHVDHLWNSRQRLGDGSRRWRIP
jgi:hypothetical protein